MLAHLPLAALEASYTALAWMLQRGTCPPHLSQQLLELQVQVRIKQRQEARKA